MSLWSKYGKSLISFLFAIYTFTVPLWSGDHHIDANEWLLIIGAVGTDVLVYIVPLHPAFRWIKTVVNVVGVAVVALQSVIAGGVDASELAVVIGAVVSAVVGAYAPAVTDGTSDTQAVVVPSGITTG